MQSLVATAKNLGVNVYEYIADRMRGRGQIPPLAQAIASRVADLDIGASWQLPAPSG